MKRHGIMILTAVLLSTAGCGKPSRYYWFRPGATLEQTREDYCRCRDQARRETSEAVAEDYLDRINSPLHPPTAYSSPHDDSSFSDDLLDTGSTYVGVHEQNVFNGCMKRMGYERIKSYRLPSRIRTKNLDLGAIAGR